MSKNHLTVRIQLFVAQSGMKGLKCDNDQRSICTNLSLLMYNTTFVLHRNDGRTQTRHKVSLKVAFKAAKNEKVLIVLIKLLANATILKHSGKKKIFLLQRKLM